MRLGDVELFVISDGLMRMDAGGVFGLVPRVLWEKVNAPDEFNRVEASLNCLLVISQGQKILIDTGLGEKLSARQEENFGRVGGSQLRAGLAQVGYAPEDIDLVIDTHLHLDHCGGNTCCVGDKIVGTFPNAEYWIQKLELADATFPNERTQGTYFAENFQPLPRVRLLDGDTRVNDEIKCIVTRGHTRAHQSVVIESRGETAIFLGDMAGRAVYMERLSWIPAYDVEPLESLETKRRVRDWAYEKNARLIFQHDPLVTIARMKKDGERWRAELVAG